MKNSYKAFERTADALWRQGVYERWKGRCAICGSVSKQLHCHHYIGRRNKSTRWYVPNGILLCAYCHKFSTYSAHENPEWFRQKMIELLGEEWLQDITQKANQIWDKNRKAILIHLQSQLGGSRNAC
jgi:predicted restriction endonuclease